MGAIEDNSSVGSGYPIFPRFLPGPILDNQKYVVHFARTRGELDAVQRLRYEVFNLELGEGLDESHLTERDADRFDEVCHQLLVTDRETSRVVGTYRMQTGEMAAAHHGFYSSDEFCLDMLPDDVLRDSVEVGRASVAREHRNRHVLFLLWRGIAAYMLHNRKRYLFGCCSLTSQDPAEGKRVMDHLEVEARIHPNLRVSPQPGWECYDDEFRLTPEQAAVEISIPKLFGIYLRYGCRVCGPPALDRAFKTIDYLVMLDVDELDEHSRRMYFG